MKLKPDYLHRLELGGPLLISVVEQADSSLVDQFVFLESKAPFAVSGIMTIDNKQRGTGGQVPDVVALPSVGEGGAVEPVQPRASAAIYFATFSLAEKIKCFDMAKGEFLSSPVVPPDVMRLSASTEIGRGVRERPAFTLSSATLDKAFLVTGGFPVVLTRLMVPLTVLEMGPRFPGSQCRGLVFATEPHAVFAGYRARDAYILSFSSSETLIVGYGENGLLCELFSLDEEAGRVLRTPVKTTFFATDPTPAFATTLVSNGIGILAGGLMPSVSQVTWLSSTIIQVFDKGGYLYSASSMAPRGVGASLTVIPGTSKALLCGGNTNGDCEMFPIQATAFDSATLIPGFSLGSRRSYTAFVSIPNAPFQLAAIGGTFSAIENETLIPDTIIIDFSDLVGVVQESGTAALSAPATLSSVNERLSPATGFPLPLVLGLAGLGLCLFLFVLIAMLMIFLRRKRRNLRANRDRALTGGRRTRRATSLARRPRKSKSSEQIHRPPPSSGRPSQQSLHSLSRVTPQATTLSVPERPPSGSSSTTYATSPSFPAMHSHPTAHSAHRQTSDYTPGPILSTKESYTPGPVI